MNDTKVETRTEEQNLNEILLVRRENLKNTPGRKGSL